MLTPEQRQEKAERNIKIAQEFTSGLTKRQLAKKYDLAHITIQIIIQKLGAIRERKVDEIELTPTEQRIRDKYRNFDLAAEIGKSSPIRDYHFDYIAQPKIYREHFSQVIWR
jgi:hypothetical protein